MDANTPPKARAFLSYAREDRRFAREIAEALAREGIAVSADWQLEPGPDYMKQLEALILESDVFLFIISAPSVGSKSCVWEIALAAESRKRILPVLHRSDYDEAALHPALLLPQWTTIESSEEIERGVALLVQAIYTDFDLMQLHTALLVDAENWDKGGRSASRLLRGDVLRQAEQWLVQAEDGNPAKRPKPTPLQIDYIRSSRRAARRRRSWSIALVGAVLVAGAIAAFVVLSLRKATESQTLAERAISALQSDPDQSLRLAMTAVEQSPTPEAVSALQQAVLASHGRLVLRGHTDLLWQSAFSPDGTRVLTAGNDGTAREWDVIRGRHLRTFRVPGVVYDVSFSPDSRYIAISGDTAVIHDARSGRLVAALKGHTKSVHDAVFSPDSRTIVTASDDHSARIFSSANGQPLVTLLGHTDAVLAAAFSPDGKRVATASHDGTARVWDAESGAGVLTLRGHENSVLQVMFSPDGKSLLTAGNDRTARLWDAATGRQQEVLRGHSAALREARFTPDGKYVLTASEDSTARLWDVSNFSRIAELRGHTARVVSTAISADGRWMATASDDRTARLWDVETKQLLAELRGHTEGLSHVAFSPDGRSVITSSWDDTARVWQIRDTTVHRLDPTAQAAQLRDDGKYAVTAGGEDGQLRLWELPSGKELLALPGHKSAILRFSANGELLLSASGSTVRVLEVPSGRTVSTLEHGEAVTSAIFTPDGKLVLTVADNATVRAWEIAGGRSLYALPKSSSSIWGLTVAPDGSRFAAAGNDVIAVIRETASGRAVLSLRGHAGKLVNVSFSPDGRYIVTTSEDNTAKVWSAGDGRPIATLQGHTDELAGARFSPDGETLLTASDDGTARIWSSADWSLVRELRGHTSALSDAVFSADGRYLVTSSFDYTAKVWETTSGRPLVALQGHPGTVYSARMSPDHRYVLTLSEFGGARIHACEVCCSTGELLALGRARLVRTVAARQ